NPAAAGSTTVDSPESWYYPLPPGCLARLDEARARFRHARSAPTDLRLSDTERLSCRQWLGAVHDALEDGRGFAIVEGIPEGSYSPDDLKALYWLVGQGLGEPIEQNVQGTLLYDVRDTGQDLAQGARFSVTSYESSYHTDNSFGEALAD